MLLWLRRDSPSKNMGQSVKCFEITMCRYTPNQQAIPNFYLHPLIQRFSERVVSHEVVEYIRAE